MTIQQLEYILAVDQFRHFARAAEYCRVTQPTLSAMIQKLEDELGVKLFDRTVQPGLPDTHRAESDRPGSCDSGAGSSSKRNHQ